MDGSSRGLNTCKYAWLTELKQTKEWERYPEPIPACLQNTPVIKSWGGHCREYPADKTESEIKLLIQENSKQQDLIVYTDGSVTKDQSGWGLTVKPGATTIHEDSAAYCAIQAGLLTPLTFARHRLSPLAAFTLSAYFQAMTANLRIFHCQL